MRFFITLLFISFMVPGSNGFAQTTGFPQKGVVWDQPDNTGQALQELRSMKAAGVESIRTSYIRNVRLLALADSLGLTFYQDLPLYYAPATGLQRSIDPAKRLLDRVLAASSRYRSAVYFGLAQSADTGVDTACTYFDDLTAHVKQRTGGRAKTYYSTLYASTDRCSASVDLVLFDGRMYVDAADLLSRFRRFVETTQAGSYGIVTGYHVKPGESGLETVHSPVSQARYLETVLNSVYNRRAVVHPSVVFVYRWRDLLTGTRPGRENPFQQAYGMINRRGESLPALTVVRGMYTGRQNVFAFPEGDAGGDELSWLVLFGWIVILVLTIFLVLSPRMRQMIPRYFLAHGFYRDAVREGRDMLFGSSSTILLCLALSFGITGAVLLDIFQSLTAYYVSFSWLPASFREVAVTLLERPWVLVLLLGCAYALALVIWGSLLSLISRRRYRLLPGQTLMLIVWPRWPVLGLMVFALVVGTLPLPLSVQGAALILAAWVLVSAWSTLRAAYDYVTVTHSSFDKLLIAVFINPLVIAGLIALLIVLANRPQVDYLVRLLQDSHLFEVRI